MSFNIINLITRSNNKQIESLNNIADNYYNFILNLVTSKDIQKKITTIFHNMQCYIVDNQSLIPRNFNGKIYEFKLPNRAVSFISEQNYDKNDHNISYIKMGLAIRFGEKNPYIICHELNHCFSKPIQLVDDENLVLKFGFHLQKDQNNRFINISGTYIDEGMSDAIAKIYYEQVSNDLAKSVPYDTHYTKCGITQACEILLGKGMSNKLVLNAFFGDMNDLNIFSTHFDKVMEKYHIKFMDLLKISHDKNYSINNVNFSYQEILYYFCMYQLNNCNNSQEREETMRWFKEKDIDLTSLKNNITL